ncbi:PREDICTED: uncharacterized protein LOC108368125 [Rhagoletis zephyria]|uniref:uncharacterized protein LOC108361523 n=1 Tax=Rhagoletis zephyria TaxID=28612 RepID=UPI0008113B4F|nr:PREDICTED: uncharacterized protein LOC108361523 [Rhagoletis zephyria]XP_017469642.1 PREDICTED: uncharacterized protein LOC108361523 [Rhagoletis zephyria]XP_017469643.1 PREDICTED: uncharacterized protein LOC108361523 [Rhagoletis zephyria]XP_017473663.1 PREDICTED: uncharacterized protein LOC108364487 [Rhagoletis zephyria]XP_017478391.1 PREDICTED: uncharacterized protein LOC108368125 [Rhagoletis zephyria]XP_017478392.1 PREDICTED: uncharacterized protein LOC108368125 [Rhagoletis zephyria]XP_03
MLTRNAEQVLRIFLILAKMRKLKLRLKQKRRFWVRKLYLERHKYGLFESSLRNLAADEEQFNKTLRMPFSLFNVLHEFLEASLTKYSIRTPISSRCRLFITLIYLAHGGTRQFHTIVHRIGLTTFRKITLETCMTIWDLLADLYVATPSETEWGRISNEFKSLWNMPNCVGSIDGKHINITCPANSGSMYYNYKGNYSIVLLAVCDANYTFTCVDIGAYGSQSDGGVYHFSKLADAIENDRLGLPHDQPLPGETEPFPHYLVGDAAFPLRRYLMRPYPGRGIPEEQEYFNKRLSRARRVIENAFGILTAKWRILRTTLCMAPKNAEQIVKACIVLHNFIKLSCANYVASDFVDRYEEDATIAGSWRNEVVPLPSISRVSSNRGSSNNYDLRDALKTHLFNNKI